MATIVGQIGAAISRFEAMCIRDLAIRLLVFALVLGALFFLGFAGGLALTPALPHSLIYHRDFDVVTQVVFPELILSVSLCFWAVAACAIWCADSRRLRRRQISMRAWLLVTLFTATYAGWLMWMGH